METSQSATRRFFRYEKNRQKGTCPVFRLSIEFELLERILARQDCLEFRSCVTRLKRLKRVQAYVEHLHGRIKSVSLTHEKVAIIPNPYRMQGNAG